MDIVSNFVVHHNWILFYKINTRQNISKNLRLHVNDTSSEECMTQARSHNLKTVCQETPGPWWRSFHVKIFLQLFE